MAYLGGLVPRANRLVMLVDGSEGHLVGPNFVRVACWACILLFQTWTDMHEYCLKDSF